MEERIKSKLDYLVTMFNKYSELNKQTNGRYMYRQQAISNEIEALEDILCNNTNDTWDKCYEADLKESKEN